MKYEIEIMDYGIKIKNQSHLHQIISLLNKHNKEYFNSWVNDKYYENMYLVFDKQINEASYVFSKEDFKNEISILEFHKMLKA